MDEGHGVEQKEVSRAQDSLNARTRASRCGTSARGIPAIAEALGYIGAALALSAVIALLTNFWSDIGALGHVGAGLALAVAGLAGGYSLLRNEGAAAQRLAHFLLFAGVAGVGLTVGFGLYDTLVTYVETSLSRADAHEWAFFAGAAAVAVSGGLVWWRERTVLQHLAFGGGVAAAALLALPLVPFDGPDWGVGATLIAVSLVWGALSFVDRLEPRTEGLVLAALGIVGGAEMMVLVADATPMWTMWFGVVACAALIWGGSRTEEIAVLGIGTVGLMAFSGQLVGEYLGFGAGTALALIAVGFAVLGTGVWTTLRLAPDASLNRRVASEVAGYLGIALAMGGAGVLMAQWWTELGVVGRVLVPLVGAGVAYTCAILLERSETDASRRLSQTLLAIGVLSVGITAAMVARPIAEDILGAQPEEGRASEWAMLAGSLVATAVGAATYWLRKGSLTQVALFGGIYTSLITVIGFVEPGRAFPFWIIGAVTTAIGTVWVVLGAAERIEPVRTGLVLGCVMTLQGLMQMAQGTDGVLLWATMLGIGFGIAAIAASIYLKRAILLGFGAVGIIMFSLTMVMELFGGRASAPLLLLAMGLVFIAVAVAAARITPRIRRTPRPPRSPKTPLAHA